MPWRIDENHPDCPASRPYAVVKEADGAVEGCHPTRAAADDQLAALYASEADVDTISLSDDLARSIAMAKPNPGTDADRRLKENKGKPCPPGQHKMPDGTCMPDKDMDAHLDEVYDAADPLAETPMAGPFQGWTGVLAVEGKETGDGREFAAGSLEWPAPPLPLMWQQESEPQHGHSVVVGRIDRVERQGSEIVGWGVINMGDTNGAKVAGQMAHDMAGGVSVDVDSVKEPDVELVYPADAEDERVTEGDDGDILMLFGPPPEKTVFHRGRIRGATLVALPAFVEARLHLIGDEEIAMAMEHVFAAVSTHNTPTSDVAWDGGVAETRLPSPMSVSTARSAYAWMADGAVQDGEVRKNELKFLHHQVGGDGAPGAANLSACSNGIGVLNGGRGGTTIPAADRRGVYNHLAAHLRDAGQVPPPLADLSGTLVAAGGPMYPPDTWFQNPMLREPTPWTVQKDGKVFGHLALWGTCHTTFPNRCITPPRERDYPYFMKRELETDQGSLIGIGSITMGTGHAPLRMGHVPAAEHYDDTGTAVVDIAVGEDRWGIWVAGSLRPGLTDLKLRELRAASLSGDWRRIGGQLRLVAVLAVNVPGYPVPRMRATLAADEVASLVAAGIPTEERREKYKRMNAEQLADGTIRVRRATMVGTTKEG